MPNRSLRHRSQRRAVAAHLARVKRAGEFLAGASLTATERGELVNALKAHEGKQANHRRLLKDVLEKIATRQAPPPKEDKPDVVVHKPLYRDWADGMFEPSYFGGTSSRPSRRGI